MTPAGSTIKRTGNPQRMRCIAGVHSPHIHTAHCALTVNHGRQAGGACIGRHWGWGAEISSQSAAPEEAAAAVIPKQKEYLQLLKQTLPLHLSAAPMGTMRPRSRPRTAHSDDDLRSDASAMQPTHNARFGLKSACTRRVLLGVLAPPVTRAFAHMFACLFALHCTRNLHR
jgi:hypothetical protein